MKKLKVTKKKAIIAGAAAAAIGTGVALAVRKLRKDKKVKAVACKTKKTTKKKAKKKAKKKTAKKKTKKKR